jgi:hypothetical protein
MKRLYLGIALFAVTLVAGDALATCYKCRDQTCFMSEGTAAWCKGITNGCFWGGTCSGQDCGSQVCEPENPTASLDKPLVEEWRLVSVSVQSEKRPAVRVARYDRAKPGK